MKKIPQVTFTSDFFRPVPGEEEATNPGIFGKALALWLERQIRERGGEVEGVIAEDWGWLVMIHRKPYKLWLGCSNVNGEQDRWAIFPQAERSFLQSLRRRRITGNEIDIEILITFLRSAIALIPNIRDIEWNRE